MTVRVTTLKGPEAGVYYVEQLPSYYLQVGEPRGRWLGHATEQLGLAGEVDDEAFLALMAGMDPRRPERHLGRKYDDTSVRGFDVTTCSAPKSVSILWALGDEAVREEVLAAHDAAVAAMVGWIEAHAHTRFRVAGEVAVVDAEAIAAVAFRQHIGLPDLGLSL
jgi:conjugative relaxase-like TrwC/TraI family protein